MNIVCIHCGRPEELHYQPGNICYKPTGAALWARFTLSQFQTLESTVERALTLANAPMDIAPSLIGIAREHNCELWLPEWIRFHIGDNWSPEHFRQWIVKYKATVERMAQEKQP